MSIPNEYIAKTEDVAEQVIPLGSFTVIVSAEEAHNVFATNWSDVQTINAPIVVNPIGH